ncbi:helix-turn-helix domain-containing protein [Pseudarthrobacter defluvii]|uniref:helix-turn-helix domain-containing protein n=1 Tax=Pseudarthrobacter defluvii TaxID=410837 RepID=UPI0027D797AB|nr:helix-turn-helix domain-containing protein [Pseudarthrobacter defluvii]
MVLVMTDHSAPQIGPRFVSLQQVADELSVGQPTIRELLRSGELRGIQVGGRGVWRIERKEIEAYIQRAYETSVESAKALPTENMQQDT